MPPLILLAKLINGNQGAAKPANQKVRSTLTFSAVTFQVQGHLTEVLQTPFKHLDRNQRQQPE